MGHAKGRLSPAAWISDTTWNDVCFVDKSIVGLAGLVDSLTLDCAEWQAWWVGWHALDKLRM